MEHYKIEHHNAGDVEYETLEEAVHDAVLLSIGHHGQVVEIVKVGDQRELVGIVYDGGWYVRDRGLYDILLADIEREWHVNETLMIEYLGQDRQGMVVGRAKFFIRPRSSDLPYISNKYMLASQFEEWRQQMIMQAWEQLRVYAAREGIELDSDGDS